MYFRRWGSIIGFAVIGILLITQYQNCAPAPESDDLPMPSPISTIDDVNQSTSVRFVESKVILHSDAQSFNIDGICSGEQLGALLRWTLIDSQGNEVDSDLVSCEKSGFQILIDSGQDIECDEPYIVSAQLGAGDTGFVTLIRKCAPVLAVQSSAKGSAQVCYLELDQDESTESCNEVCYEADRVSSSTPVDIEICNESV